MLVAVKVLVFVVMFFSRGKPMGAVSIFKVGNYHHDQPQVFLL